MSIRNFTSSRVIRGLAAASLMTILFSGCMGLGGPSEPVRFYTLDEPAVAAETVQDGVMIGLDTVILPSYLEGKEIAVRLGGNELRYSSSNRWAERPVHAVTRFLKHAIASQSEAISEVISVPWPDRAEPVRTVRIEVLAMEAQESPVEAVKLRLQWELRGAAGQDILARGEYELGDTVWVKNDYAGLMEAFSEGLEGAAAEVASSIEASLK